MKIEIEIDDLTARILVSRYGIIVDDLPELSEVSAAATKCLFRYRGSPDLLEQKHLNAMAIVRAKAVDAAATSTTEASRDSALTAADRLFDFMLHGR